MLNSAISTYAACFVGKVCGPLLVDLGVLGEGKVNTKVAHQARAGQTPPPPMCLWICVKIFSFYVSLNLKRKKFYHMN